MISQKVNLFNIHKKILIRIFKIFIFFFFVFSRIMAAFYYSWWSALWWLHIPFYSILFLWSNFICTSLFACIHLQNYADQFFDFTHLRKCEKYSSLENFNAYIYAHLVNWISENFPWIFIFVLWYISSKFWWSQRPQMERFLGLDYSQSLDISYIYYLWILFCYFYIVFEI